MPVTAYDIAGSPIVGFDGQNYFARRTVVIAWGDIDSYFQELLPATTVVGSVVTQSPGASFSASIPNLRVHSVTASPFYGESDLITNPGSCGSALPTYSEAKVTIEYRVPTSPQTTGAASGIDPVPVLEHRVTSGGQLLSLDQDSTFANCWTWSTGELTPDDLPIPVMVGTTQHTVTWPRVSQPNWTNLENFKGTVNSSAFTLRGYAYPTESLLYLNYDMTEVVMSNSNRAYTLSLHFEGKLVRLLDNTYGGHNHFWNKEVNDWQKIRKLVDTSVSPYRTNNFSNLFIAG